MEQLREVEANLLAKDTALDANTERRGSLEADIAALDTYTFPDPWALTWTDDDQINLNALKQKDILVGGCHAIDAARFLAAAGE